jgi:hypothetical protein
MGRLRDLPTPAAGLVPSPLVRPAAELCERSYFLAKYLPAIYFVAMRCTFNVDGEPRASWTEERHLPLYTGTTIDHDNREYEIIDGPHFEANMDLAVMSAAFIVKATERR